MGKALDELAGCPITPEHIDTGDHFRDAMGHHETEVSAKWLVRYFRDRGGWGEFTYAALAAWAEGAGHGPDFRLNRLVSDGWVVDPDGKPVASEHDYDGPLVPTVRFVEACRAAAPRQVP